MLINTHLYLFLETFAPEYMQMRSAVIMNEPFINRPQTAKLLYFIDRNLMGCNANCYSINLSPICTI